MREVLGRILSKLIKVRENKIALPSFQAEDLTGEVFSKLKKTQLIPSVFCKGMLTGLVCLTCTKIYTIEFKVVSPSDSKPRLEV